MEEQKVTLKFLQDLFKQIDENVTIENFEESLGSGRGDNYTASLYRLKLDGHKKTNDGFDQWTTSIIYKCLPESAARREAYKSEKLFRNEVAFYTKVMPLYEKFQKSKENILSSTFQAIPKCYYARDNLIVLEDLRLSGYEMADRKVGLNFKQITAVLDELAKFHAVSLAVKMLHPQDFYTLLNTRDGISEALFIKENEEWYRDYYKHAIQNVLDMASKKLSKLELGTTILNKFANFANDSFFEKMINLVSDTGPLSVLCHGDCWTNNILFKLDDSKGLKVCFIDFQLCRHGSIALDLANLIYCCTTRNLRDLHLKEMLGRYHEICFSNLSALLKNTPSENHKLNNKEYTFNLLMIEFRKFALFGLGLAIDMIPISTCDSDEAPDMYENENESEQIEDFLIPTTTTNELCTTKMVNLICELYDNDIL
ncbi:unnamed protein product [Brassicogethes aeneus]|uniref:CHK kinase-like domain-containing protein n=1 Tax=Brassicogethes aeneus TaxID=1431903 RepID=A0A9P0BF53_BRAAE|nr:unnamed protein product [Brassicogethes aeneus]